MIWAIVFIIIVFVIAIPIYSAIVVGSRSEEEYNKPIKSVKNGAKNNINQKAEEIPIKNNNGANSGDFCVMCGEYIPEGRHICLICEKTNKR